MHRSRETGMNTVDTSTSGQVRLRALLTALAMLLAAVGGVAAPAAADEPVQSQHIDIYAHRGAAGTTPENTAAAFEQAIRDRAEFIETDVQRTSDGQLVIVHDTTLTRTTNVEEVFPDRAPWRVADFTLAEIRSLDAGSWYDESFAGERVPTLEELLDLALGRAGLDIELKSPELYPGIEVEFADALKQHPEWVNPVPSADFLVVCSFDFAVLERFHRLLPQVDVAPVANAVPDAATLASLAEWADVFVPDYRLLEQDDADRVIDAGLELVPWTVDSPEYMQAVIDLGADGVITNYAFAGSNLTQGKAPIPEANGVVIEDVVENVPGDDVQFEFGEHIVLRNTTAEAVDVTGWTLRDQASNLFVIGDGYAIPAGGELRVYSGPGPNSADAYYNGGDRSLLNNTGGDSVALYEADLDVVDLFAYVVG
jgi:glycerophosphoryl diester phosphodiesterase